MHICLTELGSSKCKCWPRGNLYPRFNTLDVNGTMSWCELDQLPLEQPAGAGKWAPVSQSVGRSSPPLAGQPGRRGGGGSSLSGYALG